jgi:hypothetical protein
MKVATHSEVLTLICSIQLKVLSGYNLIILEKDPVLVGKDPVLEGKSAQL